ncbi:hypothetical protein ABIF90_007274 [Bradyrhizobium japonicum]
MIDIVAGAGHDESMRPEELLPLDLLLDVSRGSTVAGRIGEVSAIVREDGVNLIRHGLDEILQEVGGDAPGGYLVQLCVGELRGAIDGDEKIEPALGGADLSYVDVEVANWVALELAFDAFAIFHVRQPRNAVALKTSMKR